MVVAYYVICVLASVFVYTALGLVFCSWIVASRAQHECDMHEEPVTCDVCREKLKRGTYR